MIHVLTKASAMKYVNQYDPNFSFHSWNFRRSPTLGFTRTFAFFSISTEISSSVSDVAARTADKVASLHKFSLDNTDLHSSTQIWFTPNLHSWVRSEPEYPLVSLASSRSLSRGGGLVTSVLKQLSKICNRSSSSGRSTRIFLWKRLKIAGSRPQGRLVEARKRMLPSPSLSKPSSWTSSSALHRLLAYRNLHRCQDHYKRKTIGVG